MKKLLNIFLISFCLFITHDITCAQVLWEPEAGQRVEEVIDTSIHDIAIFRRDPNPKIILNPKVAKEVDQMFPGTSHFYYVHEYGHALISVDEHEADVFAATQLALLPKGIFFINAMISHQYYWAKKGFKGSPRYGTPQERVERIQKASILANPLLSIDEEGLLKDGSTH